MTDFVQVFSSVLGLLVLTGGLVTLVALVTPRARVSSTWLITARESALWLICAITWGSMVGSLYFSEVANYAPCKLCWYQRIAMYSMAIISLVAVVRRDRSVAKYTVVLSGVGLAVSTYHYLLEWFPSLESNVCSIDVPCTAVWFREFGFVTLSFIAGSAFVAVIALSVALFMPSGTDTTDKEV